jgi:hypothetical protein
VFEELRKIEFAKLFALDKYTVKIVVKALLNVAFPTVVLAAKFPKLSFNPLGRYVDPFAAIVDVPRV